MNGARIAAPEVGGPPRAILIAQYAPDADSQSLAAHQKITLVASVLGRLGYELHLVDSSHARCSFAHPDYGVRAVIGDQPVTLWRPRRLPSRPLGKAYNLVSPESLPRRLAQLNPALTWIYNAYAFEGRLGLYLQRKTGCRLLLELEDLPRARSRGLSPKPMIDQAFFVKLLQHVDHVAYVNARLLADYPPGRGTSILFPSILDAALCNLPCRRRFESRAHRLGYFGGLEPEKGCRTLLDILPQLPDAWTVVVTGTGSLHDAFANAARRHPGRLEFRGRVERHELVALMAGCDAIVNPHAPIADMGDGVFPFKVGEALVSGALLITTRLPPMGLAIDSAVLEFDGSPAQLTDALRRASGFYRASEPRLADIRRELLALYSEPALVERLRTLLSPPFSAAGLETAAR